jgi:hypothetical protein
MLFSALTLAVVLPTTPCRKEMLVVTCLELRSKEPSTGHLHPVQPAFVRNLRKEVKGMPLIAMSELLLQQFSRA